MGYLQLVLCKFKIQLKQSSLLYIGILFLLVVMQVRLQVYNYTAHIYIYIGIGISIMVILLQQLYTRIYPRPIVMPILSNGCHYILLTAVVGRKINAFFTSPLDKRRKNPVSVTNTKRQCVWHATYIFLTNGTSFIACIVTLYTKSLLTFLVINL